MLYLFIYFKYLVLCRIVWFYRNSARPWGNFFAVGCVGVGLAIFFPLLTVWTRITKFFRKKSKICFGWTCMFEYIIVFVYSIYFLEIIIKKESYRLLSHSCIFKYGINFFYFDFEFWAGLREDENSFADSSWLWLDSWVEDMLRVDYRWRSWIWFRYNDIRDRTEFFLIYDSQCSLVLLI